MHLTFENLQTSELSTAQRRASELSGRISELEESLTRGQRELNRAQEANMKLQRDLRENAAQKVDQVLKRLEILYQIDQGFLTGLLTHDVCINRRNESLP